MKLHDTIAAISTPLGHGGIGVVRISGPTAVGIARGMLRFTDDFSPRQAALAHLLDEDGQIIDEVIATWFQAPRSFTSEDVVEISCHGSPVILRHCLSRASRAGARLAEPGEFTLRAYLNGRIDLPQAEAIRDLIESTTLYQAKVAAQQLNGSLAKRMGPLKAQLIELIALLEAGIDFAEDDISIAPPEEILARLAPIFDGVKALEQSFAFGRLVHQGIALAIAGRPNVGKSSLFNALLGQDRAIVTEIAGTTRDLISESSAIDGIPVRFMDTAGIREATEIVESLGVERSHQAMADADLVLLVIDASQGMSDEDRALYEVARRQGRCLLVANKSDLMHEEIPDAIPVSALSGRNVDGLRRRIIETLAPGGSLEDGGSFITSLRQKDLLSACLEDLDRAREAVRLAIPHEMLLLDLYGALRSVDGVSGATTADDILNRIFSTFCIGK